jgi:hypothetical protein
MANGNALFCSSPPDVKLPESSPKHLGYYNLSQCVKRFEFIDLVNLEMDIGIGGGLQRVVGTICTQINLSWVQIDSINLQS